MLSQYLLRQLNELRLNNILCDLELFASDKTSFHVHQVVFSALNQRHFQMALKKSLPRFNLAAIKKMYLSSLSADELKLLVEFMYGSPVIKKSQFDMLLQALKKVDMLYLLKESGEFTLEDVDNDDSGDVDVSVKIEPVEESLQSVTNNETLHQRPNELTCQSSDTDKNSVTQNDVDNSVDGLDLDQIKQEPISPSSRLSENLESYNTEAEKSFSHVEDNEASITIGSFVVEKDGSVDASSGRSSALETDDEVNTGEVKEEVNIEMCPDTDYVGSNDSVKHSSSELETSTVQPFSISSGSALCMDIARTPNYINGAVITNSTANFSTCMQVSSSSLAETAFSSPSKMRKLLPRPVVYIYQGPPPCLLPPSSIKQAAEMKTELSNPELYVSSPPSRKKPEAVQSSSDISVSSSVPAVECMQSLTTVVLSVPSLTSTTKPRNVLASSDTSKLSSSVLSPAAQVPSNIHHYTSPAAPENLSSRVTLLSSKENASASCTLSSGEKIITCTTIPIEDKAAEVSLLRRKPLFKKSKSKFEIEERHSSDLASKIPTTSLEFNHSNSPVFEKDDGTESNDLQDTEVLVERAAAFLRIQPPAVVKVENNSIVFDTATDEGIKGNSSNVDINESADEGLVNKPEENFDRSVESESQKCNIPSSEILTLNYNSMLAAQQEREKANYHEDTYYSVSNSNFPESSKEKSSTNMKENYIKERQSLKRKMSGKQTSTCISNDTEPTITLTNNQLFSSTPLRKLLTANTIQKKEVIDINIGRIESIHREYRAPSDKKVTVYQRQPTKLFQSNQSGRKQLGQSYIDTNKTFIEVENETSGTQNDDLQNSGGVSESNVAVHRMPEVASGGSNTKGVSDKTVTFTDEGSKVTSNINIRQPTNNSVNPRNSMNDSFNDFIIPNESASKACIVPVSEICTLSPNDIKAAKRKDIFSAEDIAKTKLLKKTNDNFILVKSVPSSVISSSESSSTSQKHPENKLNRVIAMSSQSKDIMELNVKKTGNTCSFSEKETVQGTKIRKEMDVKNSGRKEQSISNVPRESSTFSVLVPGNDPCDNHILHVKIEPEEGEGHLGTVSQEVNRKSSETMGTSESLSMERQAMQEIYADDSDHITVVYPERDKALGIKLHKSVEFKKRCENDATKQTGNLQKEKKILQGPFSNSSSPTLDVSNLSKLHSKKCSILPRVPMTVLRFPVSLQMSGSAGQLNLMPPDEPVVIPVSSSDKYKIVVGKRKIDIVDQKKKRHKSLHHVVSSQKDKKRKKLKYSRSQEHTNSNVLYEENESNDAHTHVISEEEKSDDDTEIPLSQLTGKYYVKPSECDSSQTTSLRDSPTKLHNRLSETDLDMSIVENKCDIHGICITAPHSDNASKDDSKNNHELKNMSETGIVSEKRDKNCERKDDSCSASENSQGYTYIIKSNDNNVQSNESVKESSEAVISRGDTCISENKESLVDEIDNCKSVIDLSESENLAASFSFGIPGVIQENLRRSSISDDMPELRKALTTPVLLAHQDEFGKFIASKHAVDRHCRMCGDNNRNCEIDKKSGFCHTCLHTHKKHERATKRDCSQNLMWGEFLYEKSGRECIRTSSKKEFPVVNARPILPKLSVKSLLSNMQLPRSVTLQAVDKDSPVLITASHSSTAVTMPVTSPVLQSTSRLLTRTSVDSETALILSPVSNAQSAVPVPIPKVSVLKSSEVVQKK